MWGRATFRSPLYEPGVTIRVAMADSVAEGWSQDFVSSHIPSLKVLPISGTKAWRLSFSARQLVITGAILRLMLGSSRRYQPCDVPSSFLPQ